MQTRQWSWINGFGEICKILGLEVFPSDEFPSPTVFNSENNAGNLV